MKGLSRMYVWWPKDIESTVNSCVECQMLLHLHPWSRDPGLDYIWSNTRKMIPILIDAHSKWVEAICTPSSTSAVVIEELPTLFAQFGIWKTIVTDKGVYLSVPSLKLSFHVMTSHISTVSSSLKGTRRNSHSTCQTRLKEDHTRYHEKSLGTSTV